MTKEEKLKLAALCDRRAVGLDQTFCSDDPDDANAADFAWFALKDAADALREWANE